MYGGRARRIDIAKKVGILLFCIIVIVISIKYASREEIIYDYNTKYDFLRSYFENKSFICEDLTSSGGRCYKNTEDGSSEFVRYSDGFTFLESGETYIVNIFYEKGTPGKNGIYLRTNNNALMGYKKKYYTCTSVDNIMGELDKCVDEDGVELDLPSYLSLVENSLYLIRGALNNSGYNVDVLVNDFKWTRN